MPRMTILNSRDRDEFEAVPKFNHNDRKKYFVFNNEIMSLLDNIRVPQNKIHFMLMLGYFKYTEPPRVYRRPVCLSYAALGILSSAA